MFKLPIIVQFLFSIIMVLGNRELPQLKIDQGVLRGVYRQTWKGKTFSSFTSIPYAKPPIGSLRFKAPVPAKDWNGILDASKRHTICPQVDVYFNDLTPRGNEDCLYLNVYTPQLNNTDKNVYPVMFYIHGGGWMNGNANPEYYGPDILLDKDVILVTINYRLGPLGFLSTGDKIAPGNNGLKDQSLALRWVKKNIKHFGGDPDRITIFGQSAGGASVNYHMFSPLSKGLFNGAIAHSGMAYALWALPSTAQTIANSKKLAQLFNCPTHDSEEMVECLRGVDVYKIVETDEEFFEWSYDPMVPFKPVIEPKDKKAFLSKDPIKLLKSGKFSQVPFITGFTTEDGAIKSSALYNDSNLIKELNDNFNVLSPYLFQYNNSDGSKDYLGPTIRKYYFGDKKINESTKDEVTDMFTDSYSMSSQNFGTKLHARYSNQPVYSFLFGYRGSVSLTTLFGDSSYDYGVCHGDDLFYVLSSEFFEDFPNSDSDKRMIDIMSTLWANFAKTGNPTPTTDSLIQTKWEPTDDSVDYYFIKNENEIKMIDNIYEEREEFWKKLPIGYFERKRVKDEL